MYAQENFDKNVTKFRKGQLLLCEFMTKQNDIK